MLELDPKLTGAQIKTYLTQTAYQDEFTGALASPAPTWGYGKLDASATIQKVHPTPVSARQAPPHIHPKVSARFAQGNLDVTGLEAEGSVTGEIIAWRGQTLSELRPAKGGQSTALILSSPLQPGLYIAVLKTARAGYRLRLLKD